MAGFAMGPSVRNALSAGGIHVIGVRWQWFPGVKGGTFEPHRERDRVAVFNPDGFVGDNMPEWGALPRDGLSVNDRYCMCSVKWILRGADGRFVGER